MYIHVDRQIGKRKKAENTKQTVFVSIAASAPLPAPRARGLRHRPTLHRLHECPDRPLYDWATYCTVQLGCF